MFLGGNDRHQRCQELTVISPWYSKPIAKKLEDFSIGIFTVLDFESVHQISAALLEVSSISPVKVFDGKL
jgi:hypothetical protein